MKPLFTLVFGVSCLFASAQTYKPFPTSTASWTSVRCWLNYPGGVHDEILFSMEGADTVINSVSYKKVEMKYNTAIGSIYDTTFARQLGGMRESNRKVFFVSDELCGDTVERMVYDFNYENIGDTIYTNVLLFGFLGKVPHVISDIDSVLVGAAYHRRLHLADTLGNVLETWIEGVGSSMGLAYATYWIMTDNSYDLMCFSSYGGLKYQNNSPAFGFCSSPQPQIVCDTGVIPNGGCTAELSFTRYTDTISFSGSSNHPTVTGYQWDFGDGNIATGQTAQHIYANVGWYEACLTALGIDSSGLNCTVTICDSVYISDGCIDSSLICLPLGGSLCCDAPLEDPVCGCDSVTYNNGCQATLWYGVVSYTDGACFNSTNDKSIFKKIRLLPNPAGTRTTLMLETTEQGELLVYVRNMLGETLLTHRENISGKTQAAFEMNLEKIPAGIYVVEMRLNGKMGVKKLVRE